MLFPQYVQILKQKRSLVLWETLGKGERQNGFMILEPVSEGQPALAPLAEKRSARLVKQSKGPR